MKSELLSQINHLIHKISISTHKQSRQTDFGILDHSHLRSYFVGRTKDRPVREEPKYDAEKGDKVKQKQQGRFNITGPRLQSNLQELEGVAGRDHQSQVEEEAGERSLVS